ncbi:hypothetical protein [Actinoallomurus sp. NPDC052274]|uniref:hypothetical protein n=1 Tax=Actinoallomurus sp. NPDC052274 TaxID=3155420 RepID=UPI003441A852
MNHQKLPGLSQALEEKLQRFATMAELGATLKEEKPEMAEEAEALAHRTLTGALPDWAAELREMLQTEADDFAKLAEAEPGDFRKLNERQLQAVLTLLKTTTVFMAAFRAVVSQITESDR